MAMQVKSTPLQASFSIAKICTGSGVLALPYAFHTAGFLVGVLGVIFLLFLNSMSIRLLLKCKEVLKLNGSTDTFAAVAYAALGNKGVYLVQVSLLATLTGVVAVYFILVAQLFSEVHVAQFLTQTRLTLIAAACLLPFCFFTDISKLAWVSLAGNLCYVCALVAIFIYGIGHYQPQFTNDMLWGSGINGSRASAVIQFFGLISFACGIPVLTYQLQESMAEQDKFQSTVDRTLCVVAIFFIAIGAFGDALFSDDLNGVQTNILSNLPAKSYFAPPVKIAVAVMLLLSCPLPLVPALNILDQILCFPSTHLSPSHYYYSYPTDRVADEDDLDEHSPLFRPFHPKARNEYGTWGGGSDSDEETRMLERKPEEGDKRFGKEVGNGGFRRNSDREACQRYAVRIGVLALITVVAIGCPCFSVVMSLLGAVTVGVLSFILPPVFFLQLAQTRVIKQSGFCVKFFCSLFAFLGILFMIAAIWTNSHGPCK